jgi:TRAP-type C4-dicarboxylate transport system substrate-binding protein
MKNSQWFKAFGLLVITVMVFSHAAYAETRKAPKEITIRIGAGQTPQGFTWILSITKYFIPYVDKKLAEKGNYRIKWVEAWGGTVAKVDEVLEAVEGGLLNIGWVGNVFEAAKLPLNNITYHVPFAVYDPDQMIAAAMEMYDKYPELKAEYERNKNKILGVTVLESYNLATNFKVEKMEDLQGKKIGAAGANLSWFKGTGVVAVQSPGTEAYSCIQTGVYSGTLQHLLMLYSLKLYEVAPYILIGNFGGIWGGALTINTDLFAKLPREVQVVLLEAGKEYALGTVKLEKERLANIKEELTKKGAKVTVLSEQERAKWAKALPNLAKEYAEDLDKKGLKGTEIIKAYISTLEKVGSRSPRQWFE